MRLRRSVLATPATNDWMFAKAAGCGADMVFLDLEDSVPEAMKDVARERAVAALLGYEWGRTTRAIRVNALNTRWAYDDIVGIVSQVGEAADSLVLPKVSTPREVWFVDVLLGQLEAKLGLDKQIRLEVTIEGVKGLANVEKISRCSSRIDSLIFGSGDYAVSQRSRVDTNLEPADPYPGDLWHYARSKILVAARISGLDAIDAVYPKYRDDVGFERTARQAAVLGYDGKLVIHPSQVPLANKVFASMDDELARARKNLEARALGEQNGHGAVGVNGSMVDAVHARLARDVILRTQLVREADGQT
ncbi:HpcH/HpaI aldolase/citrate lyase family protein [Amycolatopsis pithecellobii]|uniref:CoA ester lyase n=1 Tax=Amycolatopsis pithecellobii TaxID=664692 RepID=A0A6N7YQJ1_9PSEU|nr:CoA ester lyase [Amycolatopsis pithecellobii]MTD55277.1 CoA ester lyase [Amycolatopsis pithecellobii]